MMGLPYGDIEDNDTNVTLVNNTDKTQSFDIPTTEDWIIYGFSVKNGDNVARDITIIVLNSGATAQRLEFLDAFAVNAGEWVHIPFENAAQAQNHCRSFPFPIPGGRRIQVFFAAGGASGGGTGVVCIWARRIPH